MRQLFYVTRETKSEDLEEQTMSNLRWAIDEVSGVLHRIEKRCRGRGPGGARLSFE